MVQAEPLHPVSREPLVDGLRMLALAGVLVVNAMSYAVGPYGPLPGVPVPADSWPAHAAFIGMTVLFQAKAYPLLAFLFGYSFALSMRSRAATALAHRRQRMRRLLLLGVLHGALVYSGDILTAYAVCGLLLLRWVRLPLPTLRRTLGGLLVLWGVSMALAAALNTGSPALTEALPSYASVGTWREWWVLNLSAYWNTVLLAPLLFLPELATITLAGFAAGRLRWLTHRRWQRARMRVARWLPVALAANVAYAVLLDQAVSRGHAAQNTVVVASALVGPWLSATVVAALAARWHAGAAAWLATLAPAGRYTLSLYVGWSVVLALCFSGAGAAWQPGTLVVAAIALAGWAACAVLGSVAASRGSIGPLEHWLAGPRRRKITP
jgi:uncharacterized protein